MPLNEKAPPESDKLRGGAKVRQCYFVIVELFFLQVCQLLVTGSFIKRRNYSVWPNPKDLARCFYFVAYFPRCYVGAVYLERLTFLSADLFTLLRNLVSST